MQDQSFQLEAVTPVTEQFWDNFFNEQLVQTNLVRPPKAPGDFQKGVCGQKRYTILYNKRPIGVTTIVGQGGRCFFEYGILPEFRGQGFAEHCLQKITEVAKSLGYTTITTNVAKDNLVLIQLLQRDGFREFKWFENNLEWKNEPSRF